MPTLTPAERRELRLQMLMALLGGGLWLSVLVALVWLLRGRLALPAPLDRGQAWLLLPLLLWWLWLLRRQPRRLLLLWRDLRAGQALTVRGTSTVLPHRGIGWLAPVRLRLAVADRLFAADRFALADLLPGQPVQARYAPQSSTLLAVAPWPMPAAVATEEWSARERQLLQLLAAGQSDKLIARECGLSPATVRTYNSAIFRKLGVTSRAEAVVAARRSGVLTVD